jgi:glycerophosphoryl diester phosphodiesterase
VNQFLAATKPIVIGHRGACAFAPENTLAAFRLAAEQGAHGIELDAKLSKDGQVVVIHDQTVKRTTGAEGKVAGLTLAQMKELDAGSFFGPQFEGEPIPTLDEVFSEVGQRVLINVELTNYANPFDDLVKKVVDLVRKYGLQERVIFSSFHPLSLMRAAQYLPEVPRAILAEPGGGGGLARSFLLKGLAPHAVNPYFTDATADFLSRQRKQGRKTYVWTVNQADEMKRLVREGASGLITDNPKAGLEALAS